jgi:hypothetical protein
MTVEYTKSAGLNWEPVYWYFYFWLSEAANKLPATHQIWGGYLWPGPHYGLITLLGRLAPPFHGLGIVVLARKKLLRRKQVAESGLSHGKTLFGRLANPLHGLGRILGDPPDPIQIYRRGGTEPKRYHGWRFVGFLLLPPPPPQRSPG